MSEQIDINDICGGILNNGPVCGGRRGRIRALLQHFAAVGTPLRAVCDARHLNRKPSTVMRYCREFSIALSDWAPRAMRPKKAPPASDD